MLLFEQLERVMERCPIQLHKNGSLQKTLSQGCKRSSAVFAHIPSQPAILHLYFRCITRIKEYLPSTSNLHCCGALTPGQVFIPASPSRPSVHFHIEESSGIHSLALNPVNIFSRFSRSCWETKGFLCQEKSETLQTWMGS